MATRERSLASGKPSAYRLLSFRLPNLTECRNTVIFQMCRRVFNILKLFSRILLARERLALFGRRAIDSPVYILLILFPPRYSLYETPLVLK